MTNLTSSLSVLLKPGRIRVVLGLLAISALGGPAQSLAIEYALDDAPDVAVRSRSLASVARIDERADGTLVVSGTFDYADGQPTAGVVRLAPDGRRVNGWEPAPTDGVILRAAVGPGETVFIAGSFTQVGGVPRAGLARLAADGSLDEAFVPAVGIAPGLRDLVALPDGGCYVFETGAMGATVRRLDASGQLAAGFATIQGPFSGGPLAVGPAGEVALLRANQAGPASLAVYNAAGALLPMSAAVPAAFRPSVVLFEPDGSLVLSGQTFPGPGPGLIRILGNGLLDTTFVGVGPLPGGQVGTGLIRLAGGGFATLAVANPGAGASRILRYGPTGAFVGELTVENTLDGYASALTLHTLAAGDYVLTGRFETVNGAFAPGFARLSPADAVRGDFFADLLLAGRVAALAPWGAGRIFVGGDFTEFGAAQVGNAVPLDADGIALPVSLPVPIGVQRTIPLADGGLIALGGFPAPFAQGPTGVLRLRADGERDPSFLSGVTLFGFRTGLGLPDGSVLLAGNFGQAAGPVPPAASYLMRVRPDGSLDTQFFNRSTLTPGGPGISAIGVDAQGRILVAGSFTTFQGLPRAGLVRLDANGVIDPTFVANVGIVAPLAHTLTVLPDGRFLVIGGVLPAAPGATQQLLRFNADGTRDETFVLPVGSPAVVFDYQIAPDGALFVALTVAGTPQVIRVLPDGTLDPDFQVAPDGAVRALFLDAEGRLLVGGGFTTVNGVRREAIARISPVPFGVAIDGPAEIVSPLLASVTLQATVTAAPGAPAFQWYRNGTPIAGATEAQLTLGRVLPKLEGDYTVRATAAGETVESAPVSLVVERGNPFD